MRRTCISCGASFDDEFRTTICPHGTFLANDGKNNFRYHDESELTPSKEDRSDFSLIVALIAAIVCAVAAIFIWVHQ